MGGGGPVSLCSTLEPLVSRPRCTSTKNRTPLVETPSSVMGFRVLHEGSYKGLFRESIHVKVWTVISQARRLTHCTHPFLDTVFRVVFLLQLPRCLRLSSPPHPNTTQDHVPVVPVQYQGPAFSPKVSTFQCTPFSVLFSVPTRVWALFFVWCFCCGCHVHPANPTSP